MSRNFIKWAPFLLGATATIFIFTYNIYVALLSGFLSLMVLPAVLEHIEKEGSKKEATKGKRLITFLIIMTLFFSWRYEVSTQEDIASIETRLKWSINLEKDFTTDEKLFLKEAALEILKLKDDCQFIDYGDKSRVEDGA